jgi:hypothetical protein
MGGGVGVGAGVLRITCSVTVGATARVAGSVAVVAGVAVAAGVMVVASGVAGWVSGMPEPRQAVRRSKARRAGNRARERVCAWVKGVKMLEGRRRGVPARR